MSRIKQLAPSEIQKIAAGEVVERPANVVKELVENAIDAGASSVTVMIERAGKQLIRIIDDGLGMDATDARFCFQPHTTSKITCVDDLTSVNTFGFRGEALASIASVSVVNLKTKTDEAELGTHIALHQGQITYEGECAQQRGTDISIADLFFNVPARKKFLKSDDTEWRAITTFFHATCLTHISIRFKLIHDGKEIYNCPPTDSHMNRALQLWDTNCSRHLLTLSGVEKNPYTLEGVMSDHVYGKYDRSSLFMFVNTRWIKNQKLASAWIKGYVNVLPQGRYPCGALFLTVPGPEVDINIHPRKEEVQFLHSRTIEQLITQSIKTTLEAHLSGQLATPVVFKSEPQQHSYRPAFEPSAYTVPSMFTAPMPMAMPFRQIENMSGLKVSIPHFIPEPFKPESQLTVLQQSTDLNQSILPEEQTAETIIGQLNKTYILLERPDGLFVVDQHAAHERILYEKFSARFESISSVALLFPHIINMSNQDIESIEPFFDLLHENGFSVDRFGPAQLIVHATPVHAKDIDLSDLVNQMVSWVKEQSNEPMDRYKKHMNEKLHAQMACKAAVKAGDQLSKEVMQQLISDLSSCNNRLTCPHGRPTGWLISTYDIEKKFKRTGG